MRLLRALVLTLSLVLAAGCGGSADVAAPAPPEATLVVESTYGEGPDGVLFTEGALVEVVLVGDGGTQMTARGPVEEELRFAELEPGRYVVRPALRPCVANCGTLSGREGECEAVVEITGTTRLRVDHVVSLPCTVTPVP